MTKEKFMQFVWDAYDQKSAMSFTFFGLKKTESQAREEAETFSRLIDGKIEVCISDDHRTNWFYVHNDRFNAAFFYDKEEK